MGQNSPEKLEAEDSFSTHVALLLCLGVQTALPSCTWYLQLQVARLYPPVCSQTHLTSTPQSRLEERYIWRLRVPTLPNQTSSSSPKDFWLCVL